MLLEDSTQADCEELGEELSQAALEADGTNVAHRSVLLSILDQRNDHAGLPCSREDRCQQARRKEFHHHRAE